MFINFTHHESAMWSSNQIEAAKQYGEIKDLPYPDVSPNSTTEEVHQLGEKYYKEIMKYQPTAVLCQGEFTLANYIIRRLQENKIKVVSACSERNTYVIGNEKRSRFEFVQFREY